MKRIFLGIITALSLISCNNDAKVEHVERAFYFWKSNNSISTEEAKHLKDQEVRKLYVKLFEVDYTETRGNFPYEKNRLSHYTFDDLDSVTIVPTIFIKNSIFQYNDEKSLDQLADNIVFLIDKYSKSEYNEKNNIFDYKEIQIDCDWTKTTKDKYFYLLKKIKSLSGKELSCTLRLYPYKYPEIMGVPPVDKVTLMCYNLIKPLTKKTKNSILDIDELKKYLTERKSYPVHIDVALPVFYWTQLYQNNRFAGLLDLNENDIQSFAKSTEPLWYQIGKDTSFNYGETYLKVGDQVKCEEVKASEINEAITLIKKYVDLDASTTISLFDLDENTFKHYTDEEISGFYSSFTK